MELADSISRWQPGLAITFLVILLAWETAQPYFLLFSEGKAGWVKRGRHAILNLAIGIGNALLIGFVFVGVWLTTTLWTAEHSIGLLHWFDLPGWLGWALAIFLIDGWTWFWHLINHRLPFLWRFHKLHHSDRAMDVTTASRFHIVEITLSSLLRVPVLVIIGCSIEQLAVYELALFAVVQFHHANVGLPESIDRILRTVIVTPAIHKVHHSVVRAECDSNYSSLFSWWDRIFRTLRLSRDPKSIRFGLDS